MNYSTIKEFDKDFKKLAKRYATLNNDLALFKKILDNFPYGNSRHFVVLTKTENCTIVKARFFCKSLKRKSLRIIYACVGDGSRLELISIELIELYFKGDKEAEDKKRIDNYLKSRKSL